MLYTESVFLGLNFKIYTEFNASEFLNLQIPTKANFDFWKSELESEAVILRLKKSNTEWNLNNEFVIREIAKFKFQ